MRRLLLTGASGLLGGYLLEQVRGRAGVVAWSGSTAAVRAGVAMLPIDLTDLSAVERSFRDAAPAVVIHAAAMAGVADCARDPRRARRVNTEATATLARLCTAAGARLLLVSTDLVFDGEQAPYAEGAVPRPLSVYGRSKADAEAAVLARTGHAVARLSLLYGPSLGDRPGFFDLQLRALRGDALALFADEWRTPLDLPTAALALLRLVESEATGLFHIGGPERMSRLEMGQRLARALGGDVGVFRPARRSDAPGEPRPADTSLDSTRWRARFPDLPRPRFEEALRSFRPDGPYRPG